MMSALNVPESEEKSRKNFNSYAILDLETSNLPDYNFGKVGITELSIYGIAAEELENAKTVDGTKVPLRPRVLHKLTLMINPMMQISPDAEEITGLNNFMLENESKFSENTVNLLFGFLKHLREPVCLVAHNGWRFDFPILKYVMERVNAHMPSDLYCLDSIRAFHDIDQCRSLQENVNTATDACESETVSKAEEKFDACAQNEVTPKRPILHADNADVRRKRRLSGGSDTEDESRNTDSENRLPKSRRRLNFGDNNANTSISRTPPRKRWYPPKGVYTLPSMYKRVFEGDPINAHYAEADVSSLMMLMQHYGGDFMDYANLHAIPFDSIPKLGTRNDL